MFYFHEPFSMSSSIKSCIAFPPICEPPKSSFKTVHTTTKPFNLIPAVSHLFSAFLERFLLSNYVHFTPICHFSFSKSIITLLCRPISKSAKFQFSNSIYFTIFDQWTLSLKSHITFKCFFSSIILWLNWLGCFYF